ncbi:MAG TPA: FAD-dependent oxidoreductase [Gemmatimonadales bacterium]|nr:FAD-dependent oxidoreductase [Gemmatimonadales bacterium]
MSVGSQEPSTSKAPGINHMGMRRDLSSLSSSAFDLLVVGAGIHGACIAWDACLRGLRVALVDRSDFGAATSANSLGIIHGGLRYLTRADLPRMLESISERSTLLRIAPELVEPLPVLVPTYRRSLINRATLGIALQLNDLVSSRRNRGLRWDRCIPAGRLVSPGEARRLFPWFPGEGLTGGAIWYDARMLHPERLTFSFVRSAAEEGATVANYVRVDSLLVGSGTAVGARVTDLEQGSQFQINAKVVVVAAGPWTPELLAGTLGRRGMPDPTGKAFALNVRVGRALARVAVGVQSPCGSNEDPICGGHRFIFAAPQDGTTLLGTWYTLGGADEAATRPHVGAQALLSEFNQACPGLALSMSDVMHYQWGWLPLKHGHERGRATALAERPRLINHRTSAGVRHLISVEGVKYTTARRVAERVVSSVFRELDRSSPPCRTAAVPLVTPGREPLVQSDGSVNAVAIRRAVHQEMALNLGDIVFRRTTPGRSTSLSRTTVSEAAKLAGAELGWDADRQTLEIDEVMRRQAELAPVEEPVG